MTGLAGAESTLVGAIMLVAATAVIPFMLKVMIPVIGDPLWRIYWRLLKFIFIAPFRLISFIASHAGRRQ
jgi:hypothetical protein